MPPKTQSPRKAGNGRRLAGWAQAKDTTPVGGGFAVRFERIPGPPAAIQCTWHPRMPNERELARAVDLDRYRAALLAFAIATVEGGAP